MNKIDFDTQNVMDIIRKLSGDIGARFSGTQNCIAAGNYIRSYLEQLGLHVSEQTFKMPVSTMTGYNLEILEPALGEILCKPLHFTNDTPDEGIVGEMVYVEGLDDAQIGPGLKGKIILCSLSGVQGAGYAPHKLFQHGPAAIILISLDPGFKPRNDIAHELIYLPFEPVPVFLITWEDGYRLVQQNAKKARLLLKTEKGWGNGRNIIGELRGTMFPDEIIVIGGHYDSPPDVVSATDNASGAAMMMEIARLFAVSGSKRTLRFIAWDAEECGMVGSKLYATDLMMTDRKDRKKEGFNERRDKTLLDRHVLCINMDVLGMALGHHACYVIGPEELSGSMRVLSRELGVPQQVIQDELYGSDHESLAWAGIPSLDFSRIGPSMRYIHTADDTLDLIHPARLQEIGNLLHTFLQRYAANAITWPFERRIPQKQEMMLRNKFEKALQWKMDENIDE